MIDLTPFLEKYYSPTEPIILACSTGPDSIFLLHKLLETQYKKNIIAVYFNHKLRIEADEEQYFLMNLGKKMGFQVEIGSEDIKKLWQNKSTSIGIEELARQKRYDFFSQLCKKYKTLKIMTAHHLDDRIETFFFHLLRGSKITGFINMTEFSGNIIRPLLHLEKKDILQYLHENQLEYRIDQTNTENEMTRNFLRNEIIPQFYRINENFKKNIKNTLFYFEEIKKNIDMEVQTFLASTSHKQYFEIDAFHQLSLFLQKEVIRYLYFLSNNHSTLGLSEANIKEIIKFINGKNNKTKKEIRGLKMKKDGNKIFY